MIIVCEPARLYHTQMHAWVQYDINALNFSDLAGPPLVVACHSVFCGDNCRMQSKLLVVAAALRLYAANRVHRRYTVPRSST